MKNEALNNTDRKIEVGEDKVLIVLYISVLISFIISLVIFALPANAAERMEDGMVNGLVKVQPNVDGQRMHELGLKLTNKSGNVYAIHISADKLNSVKGIKGISSLELDQMAESGTPDPLNNTSIFAKYQGSGVVVGMLSNVSNIDTDGINNLDKLEGAANVGFMSFRSNDPNSTVAMRNLYIGESNMLRALHYMMNYAKTIERPLVIELVLDPNKSINPLFVQACENIAGASIQFINNSDNAVLMGSGNQSMCYSLSLVNRETGTTSDRTAFWCEGEDVNFEMLMMGTDGNNCSVSLDNKRSENAFITVKNNSANEIVLTSMDENGDMQYFHILSGNGEKQMLGSSQLFNGMTVMSVSTKDSKKGLAPFHSKASVIGGNDVAFNANVETIDMSDGLGSEFGFTTDDVAIKLANQKGKLEIEISEVTVNDLSITVFDQDGSTVYFKQPGTEVESMTAKLDLSTSGSGVYILKVKTSTETKDYALVMR